MTNGEKYKTELAYIDKFWDKVTIKPKRREKYFNLILKKSKKRMHKNILNVPKSFIVPNDKKFTHIFYWDTFFIFKGLLKTKREWLLRSMVDNFTYLYDKYGIIPNFNSPASTGRSQPPLLTSMILDTYYGFYFAHKRRNRIKKLVRVRGMEYYRQWLEHATDAAKREYWHVWIDQEGFFHHKVEGYALSRYGDRDIGYAHSAELESGWDFTSRFYNRCNEFLPIDLNSFLYKYERDFAKVAKILGYKEEEKQWEEAFTKRREEINKHMWNSKEGFFFDYGYVHSRQSDFYSLAGFTPLWTGLATPAQAKQMIKKLPLFETENGLTITAEKSLAPQVNLKDVPDRFRPAIEDILKPKQWDYPNIWPPLEYLTVIGLLKYGYVADAIRIMKKSLVAQSKIFASHGTFFEKIDGIKGEITGNYHYENQGGFGWTNAAFYRYVQILDTLESGENIYVSPKASEAPFKLSIFH